MDKILGSLMVSVNGSPMMHVGVYRFEQANEIVNVVRKCLDDKFFTMNARSERLSEAVNLSFEFTVRG